MNFCSRVVWACAILASVSVCFAQEKPLTPDLALINDPKAWNIINAQATTSLEDGRRVVRLDPVGGNTPGKSNNAFALVQDIPFDQGTIEIDLQGNGPIDASFLGIAFNVANEKTFEAIYFRPFNFTREGFRDHAVQYVAPPEHTWDKLRKDKPGMFESKIDPVPDPADWFHARIEVGAQKVSVWVNNAKQPCLVVDRLATPGKGKIGLWVDSRIGAFRNLKIQPAAKTSENVPRR